MRLSTVIDVWRIVLGVSSHWDSFPWCRWMIWLIQSEQLQHVWPTGTRNIITNDDKGSNFWTPPHVINPTAAVSRSSEKYSVYKLDDPLERKRVNEIWSLSFLVWHTSSAIDRININLSLSVLCRMERICLHVWVVDRRNCSITGRDCGPNF